MEQFHKKRWLCPKCGIEYAGFDTFAKSPCPVCKNKEKINTKTDLIFSATIQSVLRELGKSIHRVFYNNDWFDEANKIIMLLRELDGEKELPKRENGLNHTHGTGVGADSDDSKPSKGIDKDLLLEWFDINTDVCLKEIYKIPPPNQQERDIYEAILSYIKRLRDRIEEGTYDLKESLLWDGKSGLDIDKKLMEKIRSLQTNPNSKYYKLLRKQLKDKTERIEKLEAWKKDMDTMDYEHRFSTHRHKEIKTVLDITREAFDRIDGYDIDMRDLVEKIDTELSFYHIKENEREGLIYNDLVMLKSEVLDGTTWNLSEYRAKCRQLLTGINNILERYFIK